MKGNRTVFLGQIRGSIDEDMVRRKFSQFGRVLDVSLKDTFGFIKFEHDYSATDAIETLHRKDVFGIGPTNVCPGKNTDPVVDKMCTICH